MIFNLLFSLNCLFLYLFVHKWCRSQSALIVVTRSCPLVVIIDTMIDTDVGDGHRVIQFGLNIVTILYSGL